MKTFKEKFILVLIKQTTTLYIGTITSYDNFVLTCKLQVARSFSINICVVIFPKVIGRMGQNLVWYCFLIDPSCVANCKEIRRGHVYFMLIWYGMTQ